MENELNGTEMKRQKRFSVPVSGLLTRFGMVTLCFHMVTMLLSLLMNVNLLKIIDYVLLGIMGFSTILYAGKKQIPVRFQPAQVLLVLFMGWFILSCISMSVTFGNDWVNYNAFSMLNTAVSLFLAFPLGYIMIRGKSRTDAEQKDRPPVPVLVLAAGWTVFMAYVLIRIFQGGTITTPNGGVIRMDLGLELNCHYNYTGAIEMLFFLVCCFLAVRCDAIPFKILYGLAAGIHYMALALSNSRTSVLSTLAGFAAMTGIAVYLRLYRKKKPYPILWSVFAALIAGAAFYLLSGQVINLLSSATNTTVAARSTIGEVAGNPTFTGRTEIWEATIEGIFSSFRTALFGVTPMSVANMINQMMNTPGVYAHAHNEFLQIAAAMGIPGLCLFLGWFFLMLKNAWILFFIQKNKTPFLMIPVLILAMMLANQMEAFLIYGNEIVGFAFFLLCGILHGKVNEPLAAGTVPRWLTRIRKRIGKTVIVKV